VSQGDPTDHALATIASILDQSETRRGQDKPAPPVQAVTEQAVEDKPAPPDREAVAAVDADGYSKVGPGPLAAIRFKWTVRRGDDGQFYVHETVGDNTAPVVSGPFNADAAIRLVDEREAEAQRRYDRLKTEMAARVDTAELIRLGGGDL
jgi:hypothetical protein